MHPRLFKDYDRYIAKCLQYNIEQQDLSDAEDVEFGHNDHFVWSYEFESRFSDQETDELILVQRIKQADES